MSVSIEEQIRAVKREISLRRATYPKWVLSGRMPQDIADKEISAMVGVLETLQIIAEKHSRQPNLL